MTKISVFMKDGIYTGFEVDGHAGYAESGEDVVCAGISALVLNTMNSIEAFTEDGFSYEADPKTGHIKFQFETTISHDSELLMNSLVLGLQGVKEEYGKEYMKLILKEV